MKDGTAMQTARENAANHACSIPGCARPRNGLSQWCGHHVTRTNKYGHPLAYALPFACQWKQERAEIAELIGKNPDHEGIKSALQRLRALFAMHEAGSPLGTMVTTDGRTLKRKASAQHKLDEEFRHMARKGTTALDVLIEAAAIQLWIARTRYKLFDKRHEDFTLSVGLIRLTARPRDTTRKSFLKASPKGFPVVASHAFLNYLGRTVREALSTVLANLVKTAQEVAAKKQADENERITRDKAPLST